jgi:hypothetical protein
MPWRQEAKKGVISCDKPRGAANGVDTRMPEWGNPARVMSCQPAAEYIGGRQPTRGIETSQYPEEKKSNQRFRK